MDSFEANKVFGAVLGTVFVLFGGSLLAEGIFESEAPAKPGFIIKAAVEPAPGAPGKKEAQDPPVAALLQAADPKAGESIFKKCQACHDGTKGGANKVGPHLWNIVDRPVASISDFSYSSGMKDFSKGGQEHWTYDNLYHFLKAPKEFVKGTAMGFAGLPDPQDRANVISYLRTLNDNPPPLPPAPAQSAEASGGAAPAADGKAAPAANGAAPAAKAPAAAPASGKAAPANGAAAPAAGATPAAPGTAPKVTAPSTGTAAPGQAQPQTEGTKDTRTAVPEVGTAKQNAQPSSSGTTPGQSPAAAGNGAATAPAGNGTTAAPAPQSGTAAPAQGTQGQPSGAAAPADAPKPAQ